MRWVINDGAVKDCLCYVQKRISTTQVTEACEPISLYSGTVRMIRRDIMEVSIERAVISGILSHVLAHKREVSGLLLGTSYPDGKILVSDFVVYKEVGSEDQIEIPPGFLAATRQDLEGKKKYIIGWYHSHPQRNAFISRTDERTQRNLQQFNNKFISLNLAFREENRRELKTITEIICYNLKSDGKPEFFSIQIADRSSSEVAIGEIKSDIEKAKTAVNDLKTAMNSHELRTEFVPPILKFNAVVNDMIMKMAEEIEKVEFEKLPEIEEKSKRILKENDEVRQLNTDFEDQMEKLKRAAGREIRKIKGQKEEIENKLRKELEEVRNESIRVKRENEGLKYEKRRVENEKNNLVRRVGRLESENSELQKKIKDLEEESVKYFEESDIDSQRSKRHKDDPDKDEIKIRRAWEESP